MTRFWELAGLGILLGLLMLPAASNAQDVIKLGDYENWTAFSAGAGADKVCYVVSQPTAQKPATPERQAYVYLAHRPGRKAYNVVMAYAGYPYAAGSVVKVEIGRLEFELFTHRETAWAGDATTDNELERAMRLGREMIVRSTPVDGPANTDTYSLAGVAKAVDRISLACARDRRR